MITVRVDPQGLAHKAKSSRIRLSYELQDLLFPMWFSCNILKGIGKKVINNVES